MSRAFLECDMPDVESVEVGPGRAVVFSTRSPDKETPNEDAAAVIPVGERGGVLAVADGLGGTQGGAQASRLAISHMVCDSAASGNAIGANHAAPLCTAGPSV